MSSTINCPNETDQAIKKKREKQNYSGFIFDLNFFDVLCVDHVSIEVFLRSEVLKSLLLLGSLRVCW